MVTIKEAVIKIKNKVKGALGKDERVIAKGAGIAFAGIFALRVVSL